MPAVPDDAVPDGPVERPLLRPAVVAFLADCQPGDAVEIFGPVTLNLALGRGIIIRLVVLGVGLNVPVMVEIGEIVWYGPEEALLDRLPGLQGMMSLQGPWHIPVHRHMLRPWRVAQRWGLPSASFLAVTITCC